jgi:CMP-N-acetylneuraminic acid synthetase
MLRKEIPANHTPYWTLVKKPDGKVTLWDNIPLKKIITRRQEFPLKCYARNDLVYILNPKNLYDKERPNLYGEKVELYVVENSSKYEVDINTPEEWGEAELKFQKIIALKK